MTAQFSGSKPAQSLAELIAEIDGATVNTWGKPLDAEVRTIDELADLSPDELSEITG